MIADVEGGVVKPGKEVEWKEQIIIPALPQSSLAGCDLIKIEYYVKVRSTMSIVAQSTAFSFVMLLTVRQTEGHVKTVSVMHLMSILYVNMMSVQKT